MQRNKKATDTESKFSKVTYPNHWQATSGFPAGFPAFSNVYMQNSLKKPKNSNYKSKYLQWFMKPGKQVTRSIF